MSRGDRSPETVSPTPLELTMQETCGVFFFFFLLHIDQRGFVLINRTEHYTL